VDWLDKPQGAAWVSCIKSFEDHIENREATVHVIVKLSAKTDNEPTDREQQHIDMLCQLVEEFSIEGTVIDEMVEAIFDVWDEYRVLVVATTVRLRLSSGCLMQSSLTPLGDLPEDKQVPHLKHR
jgi:hypothetical protein